MWRLCLIIHDVINTCDAIIYNLLAYVYDWSLDAHKILHPILSLKSGVIDWYQSHVDCRTQALLAMVVLASFASLISCFLSHPCYLLKFYASFALLYYEKLLLLI